MKGLSFTESRRKLQKSHVKDPSLGKSLFSLSFIFCQIFMLVSYLEVIFFETDETTSQIKHVIQEGNVGNLQSPL